MAECHHFENGFIAIYQPDSYDTKYQNLANSKWLTAATVTIFLGFI